MSNHFPLVFDAPARGKAPKHWLDFDVPEWRAAVESFGLPAFRVDQISRHVFDSLSDEAMTWTDLPAAIWEDLAEQLFPSLLARTRRPTADRGCTVKALWWLHDGSPLESILVCHPNRSTLCISSQAGCGMACLFCATGQGGLKRSLSRAEIIVQAFAVNRMLTTGEASGATGRLNNIILMGMGEPLASYKAVLGTIRTLIAPVPGGLGTSAWGITVSTVSLVPQIRRLAGEGLPVTLVVSLYAPDDDLCNEITPVNNRWSVAEAVDAAWEYARVTRRRVSTEYTLMRDINDSIIRVNLLADVLKRRGDWGWVHVNPIPLNPTLGSRWTASRPEDGAVFIATLERRGAPMTLRDIRGSEIDGACGQFATRETAGVRDYCRIGTHCSQTVVRLPQVRN